MGSDPAPPPSYYSQTSLIRGFWDQNLVRPTYTKYSKTSIIRTSIISEPRLSAVFGPKT